LLVLVLIVAGWCAMRAFLWQAPFDTGESDALLVPPPPGAKTRRAERDPFPARVVEPAIVRATRSLGAPSLPAPAVAAHRPRWPAGPVRASEPPPARRTDEPLPPEATLARMDQPRETAAHFPQSDRRHTPALDGEAPPSNTSTPAMSVTRWTGDSWLLLRNGSGDPIAAGEPSYGRSQAGAILRYRLAPSSGHRPLAYVRTTRALSGPREAEVAAGVAARPLAGVPVRVAGEVRVSEGPAGREVRPAGFAVTELPPAKLPFGILAETYLQAGYVGGRYATAFIDGQARADRHVASLGTSGELRAGGGIWGGAQKDAGRLDAGPSAAIGFRLGEARARVALDYRVRVAGRAAPKSGPALTISAGF
jgi:hypothetical protein